MHLRSLRLRLLKTFRDRGELLLLAREQGLLSDLIRKHDVSHDHAYVCIALYQNWELFLQAEQWNHGLRRHCPGTPMAALVLIDKWIASGSPRPIIREHISDYPFQFLAAITSVLSQSNVMEIADFVF